MSDVAGALGLIPPHDLDAEAAVLSAVMLDGNAIDSLLEFLKPEHFYSEAHRWIFEACVALKAKASPIDMVQVGTWLKNCDRISQIGGMSYLTEILNSSPAIANAEAYARTVYEKARVRQTIVTCQRIAARGYCDYGDAKKYIDGAAQSLSDIAIVQAGAGLVLLGDALRAGLKKVAERGDRGMAGLATGFDAYDRLTGGLHPTDLTLIAARPGIGKSSLAMQIVHHAARGGVTSAFFSMEMPTEQLAIRSACTWGEIDFNRIRTGSMSPLDWQRLTKASVEMKQLPIWLSDKTSLTPMGVRAHVRNFQAQSRADGRELKVVVIDYLQLMKGDKDFGSREQEMTHVAQELKNVAVDLGVSMIALAQMNRAVENRTSKEPQLSDLRESGGLEQAADNIVFIWSDDKDQDIDVLPRNVTIKKQRNGPLGTFSLPFTRRYTRFDNAPEDYHHAA